MAQKKQFRFQAIDSFPNVFQAFDYSNPQLKNALNERIQMRGKWNDSFFKNEHKITLELACGKAEYTVGMSQLYPQRNFIAVDIKGNRMYIGAKQALENNYANTAFLRTRIELLHNHLAENEVEEIWIIFPDPQLQKERKRLTNVRFIDKYKQFLTPNATINLKTDDETLYQYTLGVIAENNYQLLYANNDIYAEEKLYLPELNIKTYYEGMHLQAGKKIKYIRFMV